MIRSTLDSTPRLPRCAPRRAAPTSASAIATMITLASATALATPERPRASTPPTTTSEPSPTRASRFASIEFNAVWPLVPGVNMFQLRGSVRLWRAFTLQGDLVLAANIRPPVLRDSEGSFSEYGGGLAYRQYFWRGLHAEVALYPSYARLDRNAVNGRSYESLALTTEVYAGYRFMLSELGVAAASKWALEPLITLQGGIGIPTFSSNPWPTVSPESPVFPVGSLLVGLAF